MRVDFVRIEEEMLFLLLLLLLLGGGEAADRAVAVGDMDVVLGVTGWRLLLLFVLGCV